MMKFRIVEATAVLGLAALLVFSGCAKPASKTTTSVATTTSAAPTATAPTTTTAKPAPTTSAATTAAPKPAAPAGPSGQLKIAIASFGQGDYYPATSEQGSLVSSVSPMFDFFVRLDVDSTTLLPSVLEKWELARDGSSWTYNVRQGIKFHNGDSLTAADVKFSLEEYAKSYAYASELKLAFDRGELVNDYTVRAYTKGPSLDFPAFSTFIAPSRGLVMPKNYVEKNGIEGFRKNPVGSGPFKFVRLIPGDSVEYVALDSHWRQTPAFKNLTIVLIPEEATRTAALKTGEIDITEVSTESAPALKAAGFKPFTTNENTAMVFLTGAYHSNAAKMPVGDIRVRQALSLAINRDEIIKTFFAGQGSTAGPPNIGAMTRDIDTAYWSEFAKKVNRYDLDAAKNLLKEAGYAQGFEITLNTFTQDNGAYLPKLAEVIQGYWGKMGVKTTLAPTDWGSFSRITNTVKFPNLVGQAFTFRADLGPFAYKSLDNNYASTGNRSLVGTTMPALDQANNSARSEADPAKRRAFLDTALKMAADTYTELNIAVVPSVGVAGPKVDIAGYPPRAFSVVLFADQAKRK